MKPTTKTKPKISDGAVDIGYYPDFDERVARSYGYEAAYRGQPRSSNPYHGKQAAAWNKGFDAVSQ